MDATCASVFCVQQYDDMSTPCVAARRRPAPRALPPSGKSSPADPVPPFLPLAPCPSVRPPPPPTPTPGRPDDSDLLAKCLGHRPGSRRGGRGGGIWDRNTDIHAVGRRPQSLYHISDCTLPPSFPPSPFPHSLCAVGFGPGVRLATISPVSLRGGAEQPFGLGSHIGSSGAGG